MPGRIEDLARHTGAYAVATAAGGITRAALVPVIARYLSTEEYGRASVILILITLLTIAFDLGQSSSLIKFVNEAPDEAEKRRVISSVLSTFLLIALPMVAVLAFLRLDLSQVLLGSRDYGDLVLAGLAGGMGNALLQVGLSYERAIARSHRYVIYTLLKGLLSLGLTVLLLIALGMGAPGLVAGLSLPPLLIGIGIYIQRALRFSIRPSRHMLREILDFGLPLVPMNLAMWVLAYSDIYLLRRLLPADSALSGVGLYQYAHEICLVLVLPVASLNLAWPQFLFHNHARDGAPELFAGVHYYFTFFVAGMAFALSAFSCYILRLVGSSEFAGSSSVIPLLAGSLVFYAFSILHSSGLYVAGKTRLLAAIVILCSAVNVVFNILLIPALGKEGAALATLATNFIMCTALLAVSQRYYRIPFRVLPAYGSLILGAALMVSLRLATGDSLGSRNLGPTVAAAVAFGAALMGIYRMRLSDLGRGMVLLKSTLKRRRG